MKTRILLSMFSLLTVILAACGAAPISTGLPSAETSLPVPVTESAIAETDTPEQDEQPQSVVTPRGDALVATDPASVNLKSGTPTLLEFFRFT